MIIVRVLLTALAALALVAGPAQAQAQTAPDGYPSRPIHFIVPFAPGGGADVVARLIGAKLADALGKPVIVENKPGASGNIGAAMAAHAPPDGYTIAFAYSGTHAINPTLYPDAGFRNTDFAPVILMMSVPQVMTLNPGVPATNVKELIALAKARPGQLNFASSAAFNQLAAALFNEMAGISVVHVPYGGGAASTTALVTGDVAYQFTDPPAVLSFIKAGRLRAIAVTSAKRSSLFPDLPTVAEAGLPGYEATSWNGIVVPAGTPAPIVARLNSELNKILAARETRSKLADLGYEPIGGTPEEFGAHILREEAKWGKVVKAANLKP
jgi:tripartite-type tricarboxylate transporter receptor subunit TctC